MVRFTITGECRYYLSLDNGITWVEVPPEDVPNMLDYGIPLILT